VNPAGEAYLRWYYASGVWKQLAYRGVRTLKNPLDLWNYQEIIHERGIEWVIETGTRHGGSALFFADLLEARGSPGRVISIDIDHRELQVRPSPYLELIAGDSAAADVLSRIRGSLDVERGPAFFILDSDHQMAHVLRELEGYVDCMRPRDYLVVEDTCVNGHPVRPDFGPGPAEALARYLGEHPGRLVPDTAREMKFACTFAPGGYFVRI